MLPDLTTLSYDELFDLYKAAVSSLGDATAADAAVIQRDIIIPLNEELTRRTHRRGHS